VIEGYQCSDFSYDGVSRPVYRRGSGPAVIVMHEVPGIHPTVIRFANWVVEAGFSVFMPELLGVAGKAPSPGYGLRSMLRACIAREFSVLSTRRSSPITDWLRALCRHAHEEVGGPGVGAVGMCLSGNFALAMMLEPCLLAPVLSQPSLPFPLGAARRGALHLSDAELRVVRERVRAGCPILGLRFTKDPWVPPERFAALHREFGEGFEAIEIDSAVSEPGAGPSGPHSVLAGDLRDEAGHPTRAARDRVLEFFRERLKEAPAPS
jgi:dienelactone hydrolase